MRRVRRKARTGAKEPWEYEIGEVPPILRAMSLAAGGMAESTAAPRVVCFDEGKEWVWRIRNFYWTDAKWTVVPDASSSVLIVRSGNAKFYRRIRVPELERAGEALVAGSLSWQASDTAVIIRYKKPAAVLRREQADRVERASLKPVSEDEAAEWIV